MLDYQAVRNRTFAPITETYSQADAIGFAKACGIGLSGPLGRREDRFVVSGPDLEVLPMYGIMLALGGLWTQDPATGIDWRKTVHAEETIRMDGVLPAAATVTGQRAVNAVYDKGPDRGALMYETNRLGVEGLPVATVTVGTFLLGDGGFSAAGGGDAGGPPPPHAVPSDRAPDRTIELATVREPLALYRLAPEFVAAVGVPVPAGEAMLRGVCSFGMAGRAAMALVCGSDPARFKALGVRYAGPIMTGETVRLELWDEAPGKASFVMRAVERDVLVLKNGFVEYV